ncbi:MAG: citrate synthase [bacterium]|jgi:citrate synthase
MGNKAKFTINDKELDLPVLVGTEDEVAVDISKLRSQTGVITLDSGFVNTGSTKSAITYLDGEKGILRYRGYGIEDLVERSSFLEVSYLLINGELPDSNQLHYFENSITTHTMINEDVKRYYDVWPYSAHPMALLASVVCGMSTFYEDSIDPFNSRDVEITIHRLLAKVPTFAAYAYKKSIGQPMIYPSNKLGYCANFLNMMFSVPAEEYEIDPDVEHVLNQLMILHADHEQNCSTSTVRLVGSSHANLFASVAAGICALWGPLHGGANQAVLEMLEMIHKSGGDIDPFVKKAKDKNDPFRLMGFGHRVYKNFDPRASILKKSANLVLSKLNVNDPLLEIAKRLEEVAREDSYFVDRNLYPNVDFYSGIIYKALGIPVNMFTVMFALGRLPGWIAQWKEMIESPATKIGRPRQLYTGETERRYVPMEQRGTKVKNF